MVLICDPIRVWFSCVFIWFKTHAYDKFSYFYISSQTCELLMSFRTIFTPQVPEKIDTNQTTFEIRRISKLYRYGIYLIILSFCLLVSMVKFGTAVILKERNLNWCGSLKFPCDEVTNGFFNKITYVALFKFCWSLIFSDQFISIFYLYCLRFNMIARHTRTKHEYPRTPKVTH